MILALIIVGFGSLGAFRSPDRTARAAGHHVDRSIAYYKRGNLRSSIRELRNALEILPNDPQFHFMLGNALYRRGEMRSAADAYKSSLKLRPGHFEAHMSRGFALFELGDVDAAIAEWQAAMRLEPTVPFARAGLAVGLYSVGELEGAKLQYELAAALDERYSHPDALRIDIRWTPKALAILKVLQSFEREHSLDTRWQADLLLRREGN